MEYTLIRSRRKTLAVEVTRDAKIVVRAPMRVSQRHIDAFLSERSDWIQRSLDAMQKRRDAHPEPDEETWERWKQEAKAYIPARVAYYSNIMNVKPSAIRYSRARTRFGSCSGKNSITFSLRLMDYPNAAIDYVIVHELAHIVHKNHGPYFYQLVRSVMPDYKEREKLLRM